MACSLRSTAAAIPASASITLGRRVWARKRLGMNPKCSLKPAKGAKDEPKSTSRKYPMELFYSRRRARFGLAGFTGQGGLQIVCIFFRKTPSYLTERRKRE